VPAGDPSEHDVVAGFDRLDARTDPADDPRPLVTHHQGKRLFEVSPGDGDVGVTEPGGDDLDQHLVVSWIVDFDRLDTCWRRRRETLLLVVSWFVEYRRGRFAGHVDHVHSPSLMGVGDRIRFDPNGWCWVLLRWTSGDRSFG